MLSQKKQFESYAQALEHVRSGMLLWYKAPLDANPMMVEAKVIGGKKPKS